MKLLALVALAILLNITGCGREPHPPAPERIQQVPIEEQRAIILRPEAEALRTTAYRQGPIIAPQLIHVPCRGKSQTRKQPTIVETIIDAEGRVALATVIGGARGPQVDRKVRACLASARFTPARIENRPIPVYFNLTLMLEAH